MMFRKSIYLIIVIAMSFVLTGSASALDLTVPSGQTYVITTDKSYNKIEVFGTLIIESGDVTVAARSQLDGGEIIVNGGTLTVLSSALRFDVGKGNGGAITMNDGLFRVDADIKLPDDSGGTTTVTLNGGILSVLTAQVYLDRGYSCVAGGGVFRIDGDVEGQGDNDPRQWLAEGALTPAPGYSIEDINIEYVAAGGYTEVSTDSTAKVYFQNDGSGAFETVSNVELPVVLSKAQPVSVTVNYAITGGTAVGGGIDYLSDANSFTIDPCQTTGTISLTVMDDDKDEDDETIEVTLLSVTDSNVILGSITQHTYTIIDPRPYVEFNSSSSMSAEQDLSAQIAVSLSHESDETVEVNYAVTGGTATGGGVDYNLAPDTLTFLPGQITKDINITIVDDEEEEGGETVEITLSGQTNAKLGTKSTHILTISDLPYAPFPDSATVGLWLFDEADYPHTTLTDASEYEKADLCLMDGGTIIAGRYGNALNISGSNYALCYAGFAGKVPEEELREADGTPSGLWGPTEGSGPLLNGLAGNNWTIELWLNLSSAASGAYIIDMGQAYEPGLSLTLTGSVFILTNNYAGVMAGCVTGPLTSGWHHVAFTRSGSTMRHFYDGIEQTTPTVLSVAVQPIPDLQAPSDREHESRGFESMSYEQRRQNRFNFAVGADRHGLNSVTGKVDEMRISDVIRYSANFTPQSFSRNYGAGALAPSIANGPSLLFNDLPGVLNLGSRKHMFIDNTLFDTTTSLSITMNQPYGKQEIGKDFTIAKASWRPSVYDVDGVVYMAIPEGYGSPTGNTFLATSPDGLTFTMQGTIIADVPFYGSFFKDFNPNIAPAEQYKVNAFVANRGMYMFISSDGANWRRNETIQLPLRSGGGGECYWDDQQGQYASFVKRDSSFDDPECSNASGRVAPGFWTDEILKAWPFYHMVTPYFEGYPFPSVTCEGPVIFDVTAATQVYRTRAIKYPWAPDVYLAYVWRYPDDDGPRHVDLGISRDGENWSFFASSSSGPWYIPLGSAEEELSIYGLILRGDEIWQYVDEGGAHGGSAPRKYYRYKQRLDGFVSLDAGSGTGSGTTLAFIFEGNKLVLNINASAGLAKVALTDDSGSEISGFSLADCDAITADSTEYEVSWNGSSNVGSLEGTPVRLKFEMLDTKLYALQFVEGTPACWDCQYWPLGDIDGDGYVNANDVAPIINHFGEATNNDNICIDVDKDGFITGGDVVPIINNFGTGDGVPCP